MRQFICQSCRKLLFENMVCKCGAGYVRPAAPPPAYPQHPPTAYSPVAYHPPVKEKPKRPPGQIMILVASIISILLATIGVLGTFPQRMPCFSCANCMEQLFEFTALFLILGMSIFCLTLAKYKSKAIIPLVCGILILALLIASLFVIPDTPLLVIFGCQTILIIIGAARRKMSPI